jgi:hypothetical protein
VLGEGPLSKTLSKTAPKGREFRKHIAVGKRRKTIGEQPPDRVLYSGYRNLEYCDYIKLELDVGNGEKLHILVESGAVNSPLRSKRLLVTTEFEPRDRVRMKSVEGS